MLVNKDTRIYLQSSLYLNKNWTGDDRYYVIDETKEENQELINKIKEYSPYMELVIENDELIDIIPTERPPEPNLPKEPTLEEKIELKLAENTTETLELITALNEQKKLEQAQLNAEIIERINEYFGRE